jgi:hypothetical protein
MKTSFPRDGLVSARVALAVSLFGVATSFVVAAGPTRTYTTDADFDLGVLFNVNHTAPNSNQLQFNVQSSTFPLLWVANAGEDTISKIDTNTGKELARYRTWFQGPPNVNHLNDPFSGAAPSRTAVDADGNCYVANRHFDGRVVEVVKILAAGGIDRNGNGVIDTSTDANNNGIIDPAEIKPMVDSTANTIVDVSEIQDERVAWVARVGAANGLGRSLTIAPDGSIWVGMFNARVYYKLSSATGAVLAGPINVAPNTPYGAVVDALGTLWGASLSNNLLKLDTNTNTFVGTFTHSGSNYGIGYGNSRVYLGFSSPVRYFNPATNTFTVINLGFAAYGVSLTSNGDIVVHGSSVGLGGSGSNGGVTRFRTDGSIVWTKPNQVGAADFGGRGCIPDSNGDIWTINLNTHNISKYRGSDGAPLGVFPVGNSPYSYSDATGSTFVQTIGLGRWTAVFDTGANATDDAVISWTASVPGASSLVVATAASNTKSAPGDYIPADFVPVTNGGTASLAGRYQAVQVTFTADPGTSQSPVLLDLKIQAPGICAPLDVNGDGCVDTTDMNLVLAAVRARSTDLKYDVNCDGIVHITDSRYLATRYTNPGGAPCPVQ